MQSNEISGKFLGVFKRQTKNGKEQTELRIIEDAENYRGEAFQNVVKFSLFGHMLNRAEKLEMGQDVKVFFTVKGREWEGQVFLDLECQYIHASIPVKQHSQQQPKPQPQQQPRFTHDDIPADLDKVPF